MANEPVTSKDIDELLRFLPLFELPGRKFVERSAGGERTAGGAIVMPYPVYTADVEQFFHLAAQPCWTDHEYVPAEAGKMLQDDELVAKATLAEIKMMLTYCVRGERFCDGHWEAVLGSGRIAALLQRLDALRQRRTG